MGCILPHAAPTLGFFLILSNSKRTAPGVKSTSPSRASRKVFSAYKIKIIIEIEVNSMSFSLRGCNEGVVEMRDILKTGKTREGS